MKARLLACALVLAAVACAFGGTLDGGFFMDDHYFLREIHRTGGLERTLSDLTGNWLGFTGFAYYRPLVTASFAVDHALFGLQPWGYHFTNLLLHALNALLVIALVRRIYPRAGLLGALAAALLFATHPVHPNAVGWVAARSDLLVGLGTLAMLATFARVWSTAGGKLSLVGTMCFAVALASKESGVVALALTALLPVASPWRRRLLGLAPCIGLLAAYGCCRLAFLETGLALHEGAAGGPLAAVVSFGGQLMQVVAPPQAVPWLGVVLLVFLVPALRDLAARRGRAFLGWAVALLTLSLAPVTPILGNLDTTLFAGFSRYWYLGVVGIAVLAAPAVAGAGRWRAVPFVAALALALLNAHTSRRLFDEHLRQPSELVTEAARLLDSSGGSEDHARINVLLAAPDSMYGDVHALPMAFTVAATRPFINRDVPLYPMDLPALGELVKLHGGHHGFAVFGFDAATGRMRLARHLPAAPRWRHTVPDGPFRLPEGVWLDIDAGGRSPLSFDVLRVEGIAGTGLLLAHVETDLGVFTRETLVVEKAEAAVFTFRDDADFLQATKMFRIRLQRGDPPLGPRPILRELLIEGVVLADLPAADFLDAPNAGAAVAMPPAFDWKESAPRELGVRFLTVFGPDPMPGKFPLRARDGIPARIQKKLVVGANFGSGWFLVSPVAPAPARRRHLLLPLRVKGF